MRDLVSLAALLADKLSPWPGKTNLEGRSECLIFPWTRHNGGERNHDEAIAILIIGVSISVANECHFFLPDCSLAVDRAYNLRDERVQVRRKLLKEQETRRKKPKKERRIERKVDGKRGSERRFR